VIISDSGAERSVVRIRVVDCPGAANPGRTRRDKLRDMTGTRMAAEMAEQPARLRQLIGRCEDIVGRVRAVAPTPLHGIALVARGSSDHAAIYGRYLLEAATGKPVSLAAPSLQTLYGVEVDYRGQLVIAVSQSGATPEIVRTLEALQGAGGRGLALTNDPGSPLARGAHEVVALDMGEEQAVPATKTVTGQMMAFAIIAVALGRVPFTRDELQAVPRWVQAVLDDPGAAAIAAEALGGESPLIIVARGYLFAAALETALKIKETCALFADGYSSADLRHGPIATVTDGLPVVALCAEGPALSDMTSLVDELRARQAIVVVVSSSDGAAVSLPGEVPEPLAPIVAVVRGQQLAYELALRLGHDPDSPKGLTKITQT
jgi:glucosamine--fructose-6-phosphate aminotransferase (isomerizing)